MDKKKERTQVEKAERLQNLWLDWMETAVENGTATSTDMATLARVLMSNGWSLDPKMLPQGLKDKLTANVAFDEDEHGEARMSIMR